MLLVSGVKPTRPDRKGVWVEMEIVGRLAIASESMKVCLRVLKKGNKSRYDTYSVKDVPLFR